jgi:hypothetical protein
MTDIRAFLDSIAAQPKTYRVTSTFSDGKVRTFDAHSEAAANSHANGLRRFLNRKETRRAGVVVWLASVAVEAI